CPVCPNWGTPSRRRASLPRTGPPMRSTRGVLLFALAAIGCEAANPPPAGEPAPPAARPSSSHPPPSASVAGRVLWSGPVPHADPVTAFRFAADGAMTVLSRPAPNLPAVGADGGVGGAVV